MSTTFDFSLTHTRESSQYSKTMLPDPKNMGKIVGIWLQSCKQAEIYAISIYFRFVAAIFDFLLTQMSFQFKH